MRTGSVRIAVVSLMLLGAAACSETSSPPTAEEPWEVIIPLGLNSDLQVPAGNALTREKVELHEAGNRACIHAIGDWAIDIALNAVEEAVKSGEWEDPRHRIEHAGFVRPDQLERMARLGVAVSASIGFCHPIGDSHIDALGEERLVGYYPMRSFGDHGIVAGGNSDGFGKNWAITGIHGCVTRRSSTGRSLAEEQAIPVLDAIRAYTINGAYLENKEDEKGSIEPGKLADFVVLDRDIMTIDPSEVIEAKVVMTIVGGEVVYERDLLTQ